jgi:hypothetical protein
MLRRRIITLLLRPPACTRLHGIAPKSQLILANKPFNPHLSKRVFFRFKTYFQCLSLHLGWATSLTLQSSASDPAEAEALKCLEQGTAKLEEGDVQSAKGLYQRSTEIKRTASSLFNLGVTHYHLSEYTHGKQSYEVSDILQRNMMMPLQHGKTR